MSAPRIAEKDVQRWHTVKFAEKDCPHVGPTAQGTWATLCGKPVRVRMASKSEIVSATRRAKKGICDCTEMFLVDPDCFPELMQGYESFAVCRRMLEMD